MLKYEEQLVTEEHPRNPAYLVKAYRGAVASENEACSKIGVDMLWRGGNAVDAAISATFCTGVVNMFSWVLLYVLRAFRIQIGFLCFFCLNLVRELVEEDL
jgi:hypothetical protein